MSGALTSEFAAERRRLEGRNERLRTQLIEAMRDKSATESKICNLMDKLSATEAEKEELGHLLAAKKEDAEKPARRPRLRAPMLNLRAPRLVLPSNVLRRRRRTTGAFEVISTRRRPLPAQGWTERERFSWTCTGSSVRV
jgi:septal ring factor EnvC (AmiA/AmiB activator)